MIPYGRQSIDEEDIEAVCHALRSDWLTTGPQLKSFEARLAENCGTQYAVACNSGTAALHMAYAAAGVDERSTVVVPANTFLATANAAIYLGARVRFCDVDPITGSMTPDTLADVLDETVSAVVPVHFAGQPCEMAAIAELVRQRCPNACLIEDASHAIGGCHPCGVPVGSTHFASMITFSFHPVKHIAAGEGGAVTTDCEQLRSHMERFRCHGMTKDQSVLRRPQEGPWYYEMHQPGYNYRIPEASCALALSQLKKLAPNVQRRRQIAECYFSQLNDLTHVTLPLQEHLNTSAWHLFCLHIDFDAAGIDRVEVIRRLEAEGVGTQVHYYPVPLQPFYQDRYGLNEQQFPGAVTHYRQALSIPMFSGMSDQQVRQVVTAVRKVLRTRVQSQGMAA